MHRIHFLAALIALLFWHDSLGAAQTTRWPNGALVAVSLSYDDALDSQLDIAIPALDRHGFRASFYVPASYSGMQRRLEEWRQLAQHGHELGNHTLFHSCHPERPWVEPEQDLERYTLKQITREIQTANTFLKALDGLSERTLAPPCSDLTIAGESYLPSVSADFIAVRGRDNGLPPGSQALFAADGLDGAALVRFVQDNSSPGMLIHIVFHGVGGDILPVTEAAHEQLLEFLAQHRQVYWVDTYRDIMLHVRRRGD